MRSVGTLSKIRIMELDNLKNIWNEEKIAETPEISLENKQKISSPLEKVRKTILWEFWSMLPIFPFLIFIFYKKIENEKLLLYSTSLVVVATIVCIFFIVKMYRFSKEISSNSLSSYQHLLELEYQMKYYRDLYQSYFIAFVPILFCELFLITLFGNNFEDLDIISLTGTLVLNLVFGFILLYILWQIWYSYFYGRHFKKIKTTIKNLR